MTGSGEFRLVVATSVFEESCRFYHDVLGFSQERSWPAPGAGAIYTVSGTAVIELLDVADATGVRGAFCSIEVADATATAARLEATGAVLSAPLTTTPWGHLSVAVTDPNGLRLVFFEVL